MPPPVLMGKGLGLPPVAGDTGVDVAVDALDLVGTQAPQVKAPQVVGVRLPDMDMACMFRKKTQKGLVPGLGAVLVVEQAHGNTQTVEHLPQGGNLVDGTVIHGGRARAVRRCRAIVHPCRALVPSGLARMAGPLCRNATRPLLALDARRLR